MYLEWQNTLCTHPPKSCLKRELLFVTACDYYSYAKLLLGSVVVILCELKDKYTNHE